MESKFGEQPLANLLKEYNVSNWDLINSSPEQLSYKMISRATQGEPLQPRAKQALCNALNSATENSFNVSDLFNY